MRLDADKLAASRGLSSKIQQNSRRQVRRCAGWRAREVSSSRGQDLQRARREESQCEGCELPGEAVGEVVGETWSERESSIELAAAETASRG